MLQLIILEPETMCNELPGSSLPGVEVRFVLTANDTNPIPNRRNSPRSVQHESFSQIFGSEKASYLTFHAFFPFYAIFI